MVKDNICLMAHATNYARNFRKVFTVEQRDAVGTIRRGTPESWRPSLSKKGAFMLRNSETIRELDVSELDQVGGGLSLGVGVNLDLSSELGAVSGVLDTVLGAVGGLVGGVVGGVTG
jgi:hypothetical protein